jgi:hypothetical protein
MERFLTPHTDQNKVVHIVRSSFLEGNYVVDAETHLDITATLAGVLLPPM